MAYGGVRFGFCFFFLPGLAERDFFCLNFVVIYFLTPFCPFHLSYLLKFLEKWLPKLFQPLRRKKKNSRRRRKSTEGFRGAQGPV